MQKALKMKSEERKNFKRRERKSKYKWWNWLQPGSQHMQREARLHEVTDQLSYFHMQYTSLRRTYIYNCQGIAGAEALPSPMAQSLLAIHFILSLSE